ncbi:MAG: F-type H+-transporting ATPase subunit b [Halanaerobiales bacterium]|nr:F-type H+-transporting ATPase subunit b [Halanaerobiales bacterium]
MVNINWTIFWQVINFLVLLWLLKRYLYGPITEILDKRSQKIENDLTEAETKKREAEDLRDKYEAELKKARKEAQDIIEEAEKRGRRKAREIITEAKKEAERIKESKLYEVNQAKKEALKEVRNELASLSLLIAGKLIQEKLDQGKHEALINQYIQELDQQRLGDLK